MNAVHATRPVSPADPPRSAISSPRELLHASSVRHLYVHLPFCSHRCGYCDFVTLVGRRDQHETYVDAVLGELELERSVLAGRLDTAFLGGGTPTFTEPSALRRLLRGLPAAEEVTVEANPETVTAEVASLLAEEGVTRVSIGAQSFQPHVLKTLERQAAPEDVRRAVHVLRVVQIDNISLDLIYGVPGQGPADLDADLREALALEPEHLSCYELEAKPGTRFTHSHGEELRRQADAMEGYFEQVVAQLTAAGYRWYETANFCRPPESAAGRDLRARHNLAYWVGRDYLGLGIGAVSTIGSERTRNTPRLGRYVQALTGGQRPPRETEVLADEVRRQERVMLGLRLDEPLALAEVGDAVDLGAARRLERLGLARLGTAARTGRTLSLTRRGRFLGGGVTVDLLA
jgi:putative oxygen-independent coproporphyrinogen III oxidase